MGQRTQLHEDQHFDTESCQAGFREYMS